MYSNGEVPLQLAIANAFIDRILLNTHMCMHAHMHPRAMRARVNFVSET